MSDTTDPHGASVRKLANAMLRTAVVPGALTVVLGMLVAALVAGTSGLVSAAIGGAVAFGSSLLTIWMMHAASRLPVKMEMAMVLGSYNIKVFLLLAVMMTLGGVEGIHRMSLALTMLASFVVWASAEAFAFKRAKIPTIIVSGS